MTPGTELDAENGVPYYCQWESAELDSAADPRWADSGAGTAGEYGFWAPRVCGLACLRMILASRGLPVAAMMALVRRALAWRAYVPAGDRVAGLIYQPFADGVAAEFGLTARVTTGLAAADLAGLASPRTPVIASVHHGIRYPDVAPPATGGHLVLVTGAAGDLVRLHNFSGLPDGGQRDVILRRAQFERFFARRGLVTEP